MSGKSGSLVACFAVAALVATPQAMAAGRALTQNERTMLKDPGAAERAIGVRMENARNAAATAQQSVMLGRDAQKTEKSLLRVAQELEKAQRALDSSDYRAAYEFAGRAETLARRAAEVQ